jgi:hypothetical protein
MATPIFSNKPLFDQKPITVEGLLAMPQFDIIAETDPANNSVARLLGTGSNLSTQWIANIVHELIHVGGDKIDLNFFFDMFYSQERLVNTKRLYNHYITDPDLNVYASATRTGIGSLTFQLLKQNHLQGGSYSYPAPGYILFDKDNSISYYITNVDTSVPYAHKVTIESTVSPTSPVTIDANTAYLVLPANMVGGYSCPTVLNDAMSLGYTQQVNFMRLRKDWEVTIDVLRGTRDKAQYAYIYDKEGNPYWAYDLYEQQMSREDLRMAFNILCFLGSPITNTNLITGVNAVIDGDHTGFYGLVPSIQFGGGIVNPFSASAGWDWESDGEPIFLYQESLKRTTDFMAICGMQFLMNMDTRVNKMVVRQSVGSTMFEAYRRGSENKTDAGVLTHIEKLGVNSYDYRGFKIDTKKWSSLSDIRFAGSTLWSNTTIWIPGSGCTENGKEVNPIEFYQYGNNGWTGDYYEEFVDNRKVTRCESVAGYCAQSLAMKVHDPQLFVLAQGVADA